jgi:hypothetical protein
MKLSYQHSYHHSFKFFKFKKLNIVVVCRLAYVEGRLDSSVKYDGLNQASNFKPSLILLLCRGVSSMLYNNWVVSSLILSSKHWNDFRLTTDFVNWFAGGYGAATMGGVCCASTAWNLGVCAHQCGRASG